MFARTIRFAMAAILVTGILGTAGVASASPAHHPAPAHRPVPVHHRSAPLTVLAPGLTASKAITVDQAGRIYLGTAAADGTGLLQGYTRGRLRTLDTLPSAPSDLAPAGSGNFWVLFGAGAEEGAPVGPEGRKLFLWTPHHGGTLRLVADLGAFAGQHPDPTDLEGNPGDSNPYGLWALRDGSVLVADAGANAIRQVSRSGRIRTVAHLPVQTISTAGVGDPSLPPVLPAEAVPTSVSVGPDGAYYVAELKGFPFTPGTSRIWRIAPGAQNVTCDANHPSRQCRIVADGFTSIIDLTFDRSGRLNVLEIAAQGVLAVEAAQPGDQLPPAALIRIDRYGRHQLATGKIFLGGGVAADPHGSALYVTDFQLIPGQGRLLKITS